MKKTFTFIGIGVFTIFVWLFVLYIYINKIAKDDFHRFLENNEIEKNVDISNIKRNLFGRYEINNIVVKNLPNADFSFKIDSIMINSYDKNNEYHNFNIKISGFDFDVLSFLKSKKLDKEDWWNKGRNYELAKDIIENPMYALSVVGIKTIKSDADIDIIYNNDTGFSFIKFDIKIHNELDIMLSIRIEDLPSNVIKSIIAFIKKSNTGLLKDSAMIESVHFLLKDRGFVKKVLESVMLSLYEDNIDEDLEKISYANTNRLSENLTKAGFLIDVAEENAKNIAEFYNTKAKLSVISGVDGNISYAKIKEAKDIFDLLFILKSDIYILSNPVTWVIPIS